jgi:cytochrome c peroxidase
MRNRMLVPAVLMALAAAGNAHGQNQWQALPGEAPAPADNPTTAAKVELGKMLYFDQRLSSTGSVSCFSCHNVTEGGDDHMTTSAGVHGEKGGRNAPTVWNAAFHSVQFWDGRAPSLEEQAKGPPVNPIEMGMPNLDAVIDRIRSIPGYRQPFEAAFGKGDVVTMDNASRAIAAYERTLITPGSAYDRYVQGDKTALTAEQVKGMDTFAAVGCTSCHQGPAFDGPPLPAGTGFFVKFPTYPQSEYTTRYHLTDDTGRMNTTKAEADRSMWRVPTLRNLAVTAPYMHNGAVKSLGEAVRVMASTQLDRNLTAAEEGEIVAFLDSLTGPFPEQMMPRLPPTPGDLLE